MIGSFITFSAKGDCGVVEGFQAAFSKSGRSSGRVNMARLPVSVRGHFFLRTIPVKLDAIFIGITQIKRFAHSVVGGPVQRDVRRDQTAESIRQFRPGWGRGSPDGTILWSEVEAENRPDSPRYSGRFCDDDNRQRR